MTWLDICHFLNESLSFTVIHYFVIEFNRIVSLPYFIQIIKSQIHLTLEKEKAHFVNCKFFLLSSPTFVHVHFVWFEWKATPYESIGHAIVVALVQRKTKVFALPILGRNQAILYPHQKKHCFRKPQKILEC